MSGIIAELERIYSFDEPRWEPDGFEDFEPEELAVWEMVPAELKSLSTFIGMEESFPHDDVRMLYGPYEIVEWNSENGTFGQLRDDPDYPYDKVIKFGDDAFLDVAGQLGEPGGVYRCIGHDLDSARLIAKSLLDFLRAAGSYR